MTYGELRCGSYQLPDGKVVCACYKCAIEGDELYWRAHPQEGDRVFVINEGGAKKRTGRNPYAVYDRYRYSKRPDGVPLERMRGILETDPISANKDNPGRAAETVETDLEWDGGEKTGVQKDTRHEVTIPLFGKPTTTYLVIGRIIKP